MAHRVVPSADGLTRRVSHRHRIDAFIWLIAHEVGQLHEALPQRRAKLVGHLVLVNRAAHTPQPFVAFLAIMLATVQFLIHILLGGCQLIIECVNLFIELFELLLPLIISDY